MKNISLKVPDQLDEQIGDLANRRDVSRSEIVREALAEYLTSAAPPGSSVLSKTLDLAGCAYGPEDLSSNPAHLEGYGE
ncbi:MAG TPA: CopG family transcriptional regulator [Thermoanaerobaculia bacterium]|nr:CopG family transcriptional regulator [Thermoanaerobaculia bacterium]